MTRDNTEVDVQLDNVTIRLAQVCAARLDETVKYDEFVRMVGRLVFVAVKEAQERWAQKEQPAAPPRSSSTKHPAGDTDEPLRDLGAIDDEPGAAPSTSTLPAAEGLTASLSQESVASATGGAAPNKRRLVTDADRDAIKADYLEALGTRKRVPRGTFERLVEKYGFAKTTLQSIVAKAQPGDRDTEHEPAAREHTNSSGCWCRKGANNASNPWCSNKPGPRHVPGLTDPRGNKLNVSRGAMGPPNYAD